MKAFRRAVTLIFMFFAPLARGWSNIVVESEGVPLAAGATVDFGGLLVFGESDSVQQFGENGTTVTIPGLPPGIYQVQRSIDGFIGWGYFLPESAHAGGDLVFEDEALNFSPSYFYRARTQGVTHSFTVQNTGANNLTNFHISVAPEDTQTYDFEVSAFGFPSSLAPGESASFDVSFLPHDLGVRSLTLQIVFDDPGQETFALNLIGEGLEQGNNWGPPMPVLGNVVIVPATLGLPARLSATVSGGVAGAVIGVQASTDLGFADPWLEIGSITLDSNGSAAISDLSDPGSVGASHDFFRLAIP